MPNPPPGQITPGPAARTRPPLPPGPKDYKIADTRSLTIKTTDGVTLHYLEKGAGHPLVFIPGWTMTADIFEQQLLGLAGRFRVLALDPRSQGDSDKTADGNTLERRALDIKEFLEATNAQDAILVGWSNAVPELLTLADKYGTGKVRGIVLVDGFVGSDDIGKMATGMNGFLKSIQEDRILFTDAFVRSMYRRTYPETYYARIREDSLKTPTNTAVVLLYNVMQEMDRRAMLAKIDKPVLYICTEALDKQGESVKAKMPTARVEVFKGVGHALFVEDPQKFNQLIAEFAASAGAAPVPTNVPPAGKPEAKAPPKAPEKKK